MRKPARTTSSKRRRPGISDLSQEVIILKRPAIIAVLAAVTFSLTGCGFQDIEADTAIVATTTTYSDPLLVEPAETTTAATTTPEKKTESKKTEPPEKSPYPAVMKTTANVNARTAPSTSGDVIETLAEGSEIKVIGEKDGWYKIELEGADEAYVIKDYVEAASAEEADD